MPPSQVFSARPARAVVAGPIGVDLCQRCRSCCLVFFWVGVISLFSGPPPAWAASRICPRRRQAPRRGSRGPAPWPCLGSGGRCPRRVQGGALPGPGQRPGCCDRSGPATSGTGGRRGVSPRHASCGPHRPAFAARTPLLFGGARARPRAARRPLAPTLGCLTAAGEGLPPQPGRRHPPAPPPCALRPAVCAAPLARLRQGLSGAGGRPWRAWLRTGRHAPCARCCGGGGAGGARLCLRAPPRFRCAL